MTCGGMLATAMDVVAGADLRGKIAIVTGATSGIGFETARALAAAGAELILPVRDLERGSDIAEQIILESGNLRIRTCQIDLFDLNSVRWFCNVFKDEYANLDILVNNAGVMEQELRRTEDGYESQFVINYLGHFLLTNKLLPLLSRNPTVRVVNVSAAEHHYSPVVFDDLHFERRAYDPMLAYGQSKTALALFSVSLNEVLSRTGGHALAVNPGDTFTGLFGGVDQCVSSRLSASGRETYRLQSPLVTAAQAAATVVWAAIDNRLRDYGGAYCENMEIAKPTNSCPDSVLIHHRGVHPHAQDPDAAKQLWRLSELMADCRFQADSNQAIARRKMVI